jgi:hypothetical protein
VDDIIVTGNSPDEIRKTIDYFATEFKKISGLGEINRFIGIDLIRDRAKRTITLSQSPYASQIGAKHSKGDGNTGSKKLKIGAKHSKGDGNTGSKKLKKDPLQ